MAVTEDTLACKEPITKGNVFQNGEEGCVISAEVGFSVNSFGYNCVF